MLKVINDIKRFTVVKLQATNQGNPGCDSHYQPSCPFLSNYNCWTLNIMNIDSNGLNSELTQEREKERGEREMERE